MIGFGAWLLLRGDDDDSSAENSQTQAPEEVSAAELRDVAQSTGTPVYWAGQIEGRKMELTKTESGRVFVRYLPNDADIGVKQEFLTVGTYPVGNGYNAVRVTARKQGAISARIKGGGLMVASSRSSPSAHFSYPGSRLPGRGL